MAPTTTAAIKINVLRELTPTSFLGPTRTRDTRSQRDKRTRFTYLRRLLPPDKVIVSAGGRQLAEPLTWLRDQQSATRTRKLSWLPENSRLGSDAATPRRCRLRPRWTEGGHLGRMTHSRRPRPHRASRTRTPRTPPTPART